MKWSPFSLKKLPNIGDLILVRYSCGGVKITMFEGYILTSDGQIKYNFNPNGYIFQKVSMRGFDEGEPTHWLKIEASFEITTQPL